MKIRAVKITLLVISAVFILLFSFTAISRRGTREIERNESLIGIHDANGGRVNRTVLEYTGLKRGRANLVWIAYKIPPEFARRFETPPHMQNPTAPKPIQTRLLLPVTTDSLVRITDS